MIHEPQLSSEQKQKIVDAYKYLNKGGSISCAHDFWDKLKEVEYGDMILCTRCYQYFIKMKDLAWWIDKKEAGQFSYAKDAHSNHLGKKPYSSKEEVWMHPAKIRLQDGNGNTICG